MTWKNFSQLSKFKILSPTGSRFLKTNYFQDLLSSSGLDPRRFFTCCFFLKLHLENSKNNNELANKNYLLLVPLSSVKSRLHCYLFTGKIKWNPRQDRTPYSTCRSSLLDLRPSDSNTLGLVTTLLVWLFCSLL